MPKELRVVFLILASDDQQYYKDLQTQWRRNMARYPTIDYYFVKYRQQAVEIHVEDHTLWINGTESWRAITEKTKRAFRWLTEIHTDAYDFVCRPNVSSFLVLETYNRELQKYPRDRCCVAFEGIYRDDTRFPSGACYTLSMDVVRHIAQNPALSTFEIDDVCIGHYLKHMDVPIIQPHRYMIEDLREDPTTNDPDYIRKVLALLPPRGYHIRIKNGANRLLDPILHARFNDYLSKCDPSISPESQK
jgi:hypothetical protein